jgi:hypothetical protein
VTTEELARLREELDATAAISDVTDQMMEVAAIVEEALSPIGIHPIVVGGLAVAYWVAGQHLTKDIDVVMPQVNEAERRLETLGFERDGRFWILPGREVFFEAPGTDLEPKAGEFEVVELASGRSVRVQAAEDVLIVRIQEFVATGHIDVFQQCLWLLGSTGIDRKQLEKRVCEEHLQEALKALEGYVEKIEAGDELPQTWELHELAKRL